MPPDIDVTNMTPGERRGYQAAKLEVIEDLKQALAALPCSQMQTKMACVETKLHYLMGAFGLLGATGAGLLIRMFVMWANGGGG